MSVRVLLRHRPWPSDLPTPRVILPRSMILEAAANNSIDANLFKEAFIKAQQENEELILAP
jgi:hypothetical protein